MSEDKLQAQINDINAKLDLVLSEVHAQRLQREQINDLVKDLAIIGDDVFEATVHSLDKASVEIDPDAISRLGIKVVRNMGNFGQMMEMLESVSDLLKDISPIVQQIGLDAIKFMQDLEEKGYIDFVSEIPQIFDNIVKHFTPKDVRDLADNVVTILETVKNLTQPDMLDAVKNGIMVYKNMETENVPSYSMWKLMKEMNSPEMKKTLGFAMTFMKNMARELDKK